MTKQRKSDYIFCLLVLGLGVHLLGRSSTELAQPTPYEQALEQYRSREYFAALVTLRRGLDLNSNNPYYRHLYGLTLAALEQFTEAEENLRRAIALNPAEANFHYDLGYVLVQQKKYGKALPFLKRAVELDGNNLMARFLLGRTYVSTHPSLFIGDFSKLALEQFTAVLVKDPRFPSVHYHIAKIHMNNGSEEKALREFMSELELDPRNALARLELGELLLKKGQTQQALEQLLAAEKDLGGSGRWARKGPAAMHLLHYALAKAYRANGQDDRAIEAARKSIEVDPAFADAYYFLGLLYEETGQTELARQQMQAFQKLKASEP